MKFETAIQLLREFYYEKNGKEDTIEFLEFILRKLKESDEK
jgi:hypothetical protein